MEVFVWKQGVSEELEMDDRDVHCQHYLAWSDGMPVGTARLDMGLDGKIGRLAVLESSRGYGVGSKIMKAVHQSACDLGLKEVWCHAQLSAVGFYQRLCYESHGTMFEEARIAHIAMRCLL